MKSLKDYNRYQVKKYFSEKELHLLGNQTRIIIKDLVNMIKTECNVLPSIPDKYKYKMNVTLNELQHQLYKRK